MELTWKQFREQNHIRILSEEQQVREYYFYLDNLSNQLYQQSKGHLSGHILQENGDFLLQENGSRIHL